MKEDQQPEQKTSVRTLGQRSADLHMQLETAKKDAIAKRKRLLITIGAVTEKLGEVLLTMSKEERNYCFKVFNDTALKRKKQGVNSGEGE